MSLDQTTRGVLDQIIYGIIKDIPNFIKIIYNPSEKAKLHIKNESDFLLGVSLGLLHQAFSNYFISAYRRYPNEQEILEINSIIFRRTADIRNAIFQSA
jgi:hypothetical protein